MKSRMLTLPVLGICLVINPMWIVSGCFPEEEANYTEQDMISTLSRLPKVKESKLEESEDRVEVELDVAGLEVQEMTMWSAPRMLDFVSSASACGEYGPDFVLDASACGGGDFRSVLSFQGTLTVTLIPAMGEPELLLDAAPISEGRFVVNGVDLDNATISVAGELEKDGMTKTFDVTLVETDKLVNDVTLVRLKYTEGNEAMGMGRTIEL